MYTLTRTLPVQRRLLEQTPALFVSFVIAEQFYKFHSFTLECLAFLVTWYGSNRVWTQVHRKFQPGKANNNRVDVKA